MNVSFFSPLFRARLRRALGPLAGLVTRVIWRRPNPIRPWSEDPAFARLWKEARDHTVVDIVRCYMIYQFAQHALKLPGDVAEVGVYRGGTARILAELTDPAGRYLHLFDTFRGIPTASPALDWHRPGDFRDTSLHAVRAVIGPRESVIFHEGDFRSTCHAVEQNTFSFVHVDVDVYESVLACCSFFWPRLVSGGILLFDDYGFVSCPGAKQAIDEFFEAAGHVAIYLPTGQAVAIHP